MLSACGSDSNKNQNEGTITVIHGDYPYYDTAQELVDSADLVFCGTIVNVTGEESDIRTETGKDSQTGFDGGQDIPYTIYEIKIENVYKGTVDGDTICIKQPGGQVGGNTYILDGAPVISPEETYLFLTQTYETAYPSLLNTTQALYNMNVLEDGSEKDEGIITLSEILSLLEN